MVKEGFFIRDAIKRKAQPAKSIQNIHKILIVKVLNFVYNKGVSHRRNFELVSLSSPGYPGLCLYDEKGSITSSSRILH